MAIKIFNPEHDLALASNSESFIPPASAAKMAFDMNLLPFWYSEHDMILASRDMSAWQKEIAGQLGISNSIICRINAGMMPEEEAEPWGWDKAVAKRLAEAGITRIPDAVTLDRIREMSSRAFSIKLLERLRKIEGTCGERFMITERQQLDNIMSERHNGIILKSLWSSSGKGIIWCRDRIYEQNMKRAESEIKKFGGITCEPVYDKVKDMAMEFRIDKGDVAFSGYSMFNTNAYGNYESNDIKKSDTIENELCRFVSKMTLTSVKNNIIMFLKENVAPHYNGTLGVDMMICNGPDKSFMIHPCVEINLRMNMGTVALAIAGRMISENSSGTFHIDYRKDNSKLKERDTEYRKLYPLQIKDRKIVSGYFSLTPIYKDTEYNAYILINEDR